MLSIAIVHIMDDRGERNEYRALLDQSSNIRASFTKRLNLSNLPCRTFCVGAADASGPTAKSASN